MEIFYNLKGKKEKSKPAPQDDFQINELDDCLKSMCILDIIMQPKEKKWMRIINCYTQRNSYKYVIDNGAGDTLTIWFVRAGVLIKGFDHENSLNQLAADKWDEKFFEYTYANIPTQFMNLLTEDELDETTFCMWYVKSDKKWTQNKWTDNDGGKKFLLKYIQRTAQEWKDWAERYYKKELDISAIQRIYDTHSVDAKHIAILNPSCDINSILEEIQNLP